jgi:hypothetical protein
MVGEQADLGRLLQHRPRYCLLLVGLRRCRSDRLLGEAVGQLAEVALLGRQLEFDHVARSASRSST